MTTIALKSTTSQMQAERAAVDEFMLSSRRFFVFGLVGVAILLGFLLWEDLSDTVDTLAVRFMMAIGPARASAVTPT